MIRKSISLLAAFGLAVVTAGVLGQAVNPLAQWGQWRGPLATGAAPKADPPVEWSETENIRWKTELPGLGHSSPVVWGGLVFVTTAEMTGAKKLVHRRDAGRRAQQHESVV